MPTQQPHRNLLDLLVALAPRVPQAVIKLDALAGHYEKKDPRFLLEIINAIRNLELPEVFETPLLLGMLAGRGNRKATERLVSLPSGTDRNLALRAAIAHGAPAAALSIKEVSQQKRFLFLFILMVKQPVRRLNKKLFLETTLG